MATKTFCDDCGKETQVINKVYLWFYNLKQKNMEFCYNCFLIHWKPIEKKFKLESISPGVKHN